MRHSNPTSTKSRWTLYWRKLTLKYFQFCVICCALTQTNYSKIFSTTRNFDLCRDWLCSTTHEVAFLNKKVHVYVVRCSSYMLVSNPDDFKHATHLEFFRCHLLLLRGGSSSLLLLHVLPLLLREAVRYIGRQGRWRLAGSRKTRRR